MANIPSLRKRDAQFRTRTSSEDQNKMSEEILFDISNLFNLVNEQEKLLGDVKEIMGVENKYQAIRIESLSQELENIKTLFNQLQSGTGNYTTRVYTDRMDIEAMTPAQEQAQIDTYHGVVTLPISGKTQSKIYLFDEVANEVVLPPTLAVELSPKGNGISIIDNDVNNAFNGENADIWRRKYIFAADDSVSSVTTTVTITLPDNIISNRDINTITVHPFPLSTVDIDKIEYKMEGGWNLIPGWPKDSANNPIPIQDAGNIKFCFESLAMAQVRVTFTQRNFIVENHQKVFYVGAQEIGVSYTDYQSSIGRFTAVATLQNKTRGKLITGVKPIFSNAEALSDKTDEKRSVFSYSIYSYSNGSLQYTRDTLPVMVDSSDILIKASVYADSKSGCTPALECIEVTYSDLV